MSELHISASSAGADPCSLVPGRDLVLTADPPHVLDLPHGTLADDYLDAGARTEIDETSVAVRDAWQTSLREELTVEGVSLPWVWSLELLAGAVLPAIHLAEASRAALDASQPARVVLAGLEPTDRAVIEAVAREHGIKTSVDVAPSVARRGETQVPARRRLVRAVTGVGLPSFGHHRGTLVFGYWHLAPLIEQMVAEGISPVLSSRALPPNPRRTLRAAARGGIAGSPGPIARREGRRLAAAALYRLATPKLPGLSVEVAAHVNDRLTAFAHARTAPDITDALFWRRLFDRGTIAAVVVPNDVVSELRLVVALAQAARIPTLVVQHGVYLPPTPDVPQRPIDDRVGDLETADEVAVWSRLTAAALPETDREVHIVGYPLPHAVLPPTTPRDAVRPRVLVLVQGPERITSTVHQRMIGQHSAVATRATLRLFPDAKVTLRPHPSHDVRAVDAARRRFSGSAVSIDATSDIEALLQTHDVCIGSNSTAVYQAAAAGCTVVILNLTEFDWKWPLAGDTPVPVARSEDELVAALRTAVAAPSAAAREVLVQALGARGDDGSARLLDVVRTLPERAERRARSSGR